jgi:hypothetical protein
MRTMIDDADQDVSTPGVTGHHLQHALTLIQNSYRKFENTSEISVTWGVQIRRVFEYQKKGSLFWGAICNQWTLKIVVISGTQNPFSVNTPFSTKPIILHIVSRPGNTISGQFWVLKVLGHPFIRP